MSRTENRARWEAYLAERTGTYEYRTRRYAAVADEMELLGFADGDLVVDVGAGMCEFDRYMRERGMHPRYVPVDGCIDGTDLNLWRPSLAFDFFVAIETIEHINTPAGMLNAFERKARKGAVLTTPNPERVDVRAMDKTHVSPIDPWWLEERDWRVEKRSFFGQPEDSLLGIYQRNFALLSNREVESDTVITPV